jgi:8-hydroxy-5-deazaflavin:NADPH oxidoreductase
VDEASTVDVAAGGKLRATMDVAVIGGTGKEGFGLALRLAQAGHRVTIGSREADRGAAAAADALERLGAGAIEGGSNVDAAMSAPVVIVAVPFAGQAEIYRSLKGSIAPGSIVVDATSPLATAVGGRAWQVVRPWHGSAAEQAAAILGEGPRMVAAFHTISSRALQDIDSPMTSDVLVCGDDDGAKATVGSLIEGIPGFRWVDCGALASARIAETMTALLVSVNRAYRIKDAGFRIVGRDDWGDPGS